MAFTVVDEQHRFGVMQRTALQQKGVNADNIVMTATPIPRTLSMTLYGDLNISIIDELPPNRKVIKSYFKQLDKLPEVCKYIKDEIKKGRQAYIVCPLIDESDKIEAKSAIETAEELKNGVFSDLKVSLLHGKMKPSEKENIMDDFRKNKTDVLISTTVIEVGVDVPNATIMVIMNSERFGLAQLHQLRGRIGRGSFESICFFVGNIKSQDGFERMKTMVKETDGFKIAEKDLELRGPGDFCGTKHEVMGFPVIPATTVRCFSQLRAWDGKETLGKCNACRCQEKSGLHAFFRCILLLREIPFREHLTDVPVSISTLLSLHAVVMLIRLLPCHATV